MENSLRDSLRKSLGWLAAILAFAGMATAQGTPAPNPSPEANGSGATTVSLNFAANGGERYLQSLGKITFTAVVVSGTGGATPTGSVTFTDESSGTELPAAPVQLDRHRHGCCSM